MKAEKGFTLVEILIVVVILGILAAIVIPQFTGASTEAKESALVSDLQAVRSQVELFKIQHNDILPGEILDAATGNITAATAVSFVNALTDKTNQYGVVGTGATFRFGPYMRKLPDNPFSTSTLEVVAGRSENASSVSIADRLTLGGGTVGWNFVTSDVALNALDIGMFQAADPLVNPVDGTLHVDY